MGRRAQGTNSWRGTWRIASMTRSSKRGRPVQSAVRRASSATSASSASRTSAYASSCANAGPHARNRSAAPANVAQHAATRRLALTRTPARGRGTAGPSDRPRAAAPASRWYRRLARRCARRRARPCRCAPIPGRPRWPSWRQVSRPRPRLAPVTRATRAGSAIGTLSKGCYGRSRQPSRPTPIESSRAEDGCVSVRNSTRLESSTKGPRMAAYRLKAVMDLVQPSSRGLVRRST